MMTMTINNISKQKTLLSAAVCRALGTVTLGAGLLCGHGVYARDWFNPALLSTGGGGAPSAGV
ncbi:hypothetical protein ACFKPY_25185, partial [Salmonella enterica subsp. enterica serovar Newport]